MKRVIALGLTMCLWAASAAAEVRTKKIEYSDRVDTFEGYLAYDAAMKGPRPAVMVVHEWKGLGPYAERRARELAALGYVAFAADIYGKGIRPQTHEEAAKQAGIYKSDRKLMRRRAELGLAIMKALPDVDASRSAAIGYCFGGTTVLELARSGADLLGVASFHGGLDTPDKADAANIKAKVRVFHGEADPFVPQREVKDFEREMEDAQVDYSITSYPNAVHSFTVPDAGDDPSKGAAYNEEADKKSWNELVVFLKDIFEQK